MARTPLRPARTTQFKRDYRKCKKRGYPMEELKAVMGTLIDGRPPEGHHRDHELSGRWKGHRDCHIRSDWVLIYRIEGDVVTFERTGTHANLFD